MKVFPFIKIVGIEPTLIASNAIDLPKINIYIPDDVLSSSSLQVSTHKYYTPSAFPR